MRKNQTKLQLVQNRENSVLDTFTKESNIASVPRKTTMTLEQVIAFMRKQQGDRTQRAFAAELGVSESYIAEVYKGRREPGESILSKLNLSKKIVYEQVA